MPRRRYEDEVLRQRAQGLLELRSRGLSYREIVCELGCSVFKVYRSRIKQVLEGPLLRSPSPISAFT